MILNMPALALFAALFALSHATDAQGAPKTEGLQAPDQAGIAKVLENYRIAVSTSNEALFSTTLLDDQIPFHGLGDAKSVGTSTKSQDLKGVAGFRKSVFHSGKRYTQVFEDIHIKQEGSLAQADLRFTTRRGDGSGGKGWKLLTLVKVGDSWKIASEFYTVWSLDSQ